MCKTYVEEWSVNMLDEFMDCELLIGENSPSAYAKIMGGTKNESIYGSVLFYEYDNGTIVMTNVRGLPVKSDKCDNGFYGFHIHAGGSCTGTSEDEFANAGGHFNPNGCEHPAHAGDMPVLLSNNGTAISTFYTDISIAIIL